MRNHSMYCASFRSIPTEASTSRVAWKYRCSVSTSTPSLSQKIALITDPNRKSQGSRLKASRQDINELTLASPTQPGARRDETTRTACFDDSGTWMDCSRVPQRHDARRCLDRAESDQA